MQLPFVLYKDVLLNIPVTSDEWLYRDIETKVTLKANIKSFIRCIQYTVQQYNEYAHILYKTRLANGYTIHVDKK